MKSVKLIFVGFVLVVLAACTGGDGGGNSDGGNNDQPDVAITAVSNSLQFEDSVPASQGAALNEAISLLYTIKIEDPQDSSQISSLLKITDTDGSSLQSWLEDRVRYIVSESFDVGKNLTLGTQVVSYPNPKIFPDSVGSNKMNLPSIDASGAQVVMSNLGGAIYFAGKQSERLIEMNLGRVGNIKMTSPRVGLLQIGPGMFLDFGDQKVQNVLLGVYRAATLFHEARHSDGNGKTLAFMHAKCPAWHDYAGRSACDASTNGPYTVDAVIHKSLMNACGSRCTELTMKVLQIMYLDIANRTLTSGDSPQAGTDWDDTPERIEGF